MCATISLRRTSGFFIRAQDFDEPVLCCDVIASCIGDAFEQLPAFFGGDRLFQLGNLVGDDLALRFDLFDGLARSSPL